MRGIEWSIMRMIGISWGKRGLLRETRMKMNEKGNFKSDYSFLFQLNDTIYVVPIQSRVIYSIVAPSKAVAMTNCFRTLTPRREVEEMDVPETKSPFNFT